MIIEYYYIMKYQLCTQSANYLKMTSGLLQTQILLIGHKTQLNGINIGWFSAFSNE